MTERPHMYIYQFTGGSQNVHNSQISIFPTGSIWQPLKKYIVLNLCSNLIFICIFFCCLVLHASVIFRRRWNSGADKYALPVTSLIRFDKYPLQHHLGCYLSKDTFQSIQKYLHFKVFSQLRWTMKNDGILYCLINTGTHPHAPTIFFPIIINLLHHWKGQGRIQTILYKIRQITMHL